MPPMPPIPPMGGPPAPSDAGLSATMASAVIMREATLDESTMAVRTTLAGSMMPVAMRSTYSPVCALKPYLGSSLLRHSPATTAPSCPAFDAMALSGARIALSTISIPSFWSMLAALPLMAWSCLLAQRRALPPPGTMPSSTAARVALSASTTRSFFSCTSVSVAPPTLITATPPESLARRSWSFSFSYSEVVRPIESRMSSHRSSIVALSAAPSRMTVLSLDTVTLAHRPRWAVVTCSSLSPTSSDTTSAPVSTAMSCSVALRLSPNPGALTAHTLMPARSLFTTSVARASLSTSSAIMRSGTCSLITASRMGTRVCKELTFFSTKRIYGFSKSQD
mmetsp:Transcript_21841/g.49381  ORF Transcript_21841/g.49381 Transcript_21841/m.49381 type:complete len:337 (-) Transcript_21841:795-1805(-)